MVAKFVIAIAGLTVLLATVSQATADSVTPPPGSALVDFPLTSSGEIILQASAGGVTTTTTTPVPSTSYPLLVSPLAVQQSAGDGVGTAGATISSNFVPNSASGISGDVTLNVSGTVGIGIPDGPSGSGSASLLAQANVTYYLDIVGPTGAVPADVQATLIAGFGGAVEPGIYTTGASFSIDGVTQATALAESGLRSAAVVNYSSIYGFDANTIYSVVLSGDISGSLTGGECVAAFGVSTAGCSVTMSASIDPTLTLNVSDPQDYTIELSPNLAATPLPSTWTMMLTGLAGLGFALRRRGTKGSLGLAA